MNVVKVLRACEKALLWNETVYLYKVTLSRRHVTLSQHSFYSRKPEKIKIESKHNILVGIFEKLDRQVDTWEMEITTRMSSGGKQSDSSIF